MRHNLQLHEICDEVCSDVFLDVFFKLKETPRISRFPVDYSKKN